MAAADVAPATPAAPSPSRAVDVAASDAALFGKYQAQLEADVARDLGEPTDKSTPRSNNGRPKDGGAAETKQPAKHDDESNSEDPSVGQDNDEAPAARRRAAADPAASGVTEAVDKARKAWAAGNTDDLDAALKAILPGSKGLAEFTVDGKRYAELRTVAAKRAKAADEREAKLATREGNVGRGLAQVEALVARYQPIEQLVHAAAGDDVDAFVTLVERLTKRPLNETVKRHLDRKLNKAGDPEVESLKRTVAEERAAREKLERQIEQEKAQATERQQIQRHLVFLDNTLKASPDARVRELVSSPAGMRAIFEAQKSHYNRQTNSTLTPEQAAQWVLEQKAKEFAPWQKVLAPATTPPALPAARPAAAARPLGARGGGASAGAQKLSDPDLFAKYERLAKLAGD